MRSSPAAFAIAVFLFASPAAAQSGGAKVAIIPPAMEGFDSATLEILESTISAKMPDLGYTPVDSHLVAQQVASGCPDEGCTEPSQIVTIGEGLGASLVLVTEVVKQDEEVVVRMYSVQVDTGHVEQAATTTTLSGLLAKAVGLMKVVVSPPAKKPPPPPPEPAPLPPGEEATEEATTAPLPPGEEVAAESAPDKETAPLPPGAGESTGEDQEPEDEKAKDEDEKDKPRDQSGRIDLAISSTMYAMLMTFTIMFAVDQDIEWYWYPPAMLLSGGVALTASLLITWKLEVTRGDAAMFDACLGWGTGNGTLIPLAMGRVEARPVLVGTVIGGGVGLVGGILAASLFDPSTGDAALASAAASWGSAYAAMIAGMVQPTDWEGYIIATLVGMDVALAAGIVASIFVEVEPRAIGIASLGGTLGGLLGATLGLPLMVKDGGPTTKDLRGYVGMIMGFTTLGLALGIVIPVAVEKKKKKEEGKMSTMPFLLAHEESGLKVGIPGIMPVPPIDGVNTAPVAGAQLGIAGGVF